MASGVSGARQDGGGGRGPARVHVCPLAEIHSVITLSRASHLVTLIDPGTIPATPRGIPAERHLKIGIHDIDVEMPGLITPSAAHVGELIGFLAAWPVEQSILIHCFAGISRSTAAAFIAACAKRPDVAETLIAKRLRRASASARPNRRLVALADDLMGRGGRMVDAIATIGRGEAVVVAQPFALDIDFSSS